MPPVGGGIEPLARALLFLQPFWMIKSRRLSIRASPYRNHNPREHSPRCTPILAKALPDVTTTAFAYCVPRTRHLIALYAPETMDKLTMDPLAALTNGSSARPHYSLPITNQKKDTHHRLKRICSRIYFGVDK